MFLRISSILILPVFLTFLNVLLMVWAYKKQIYNAIVFRLSLGNQIKNTHD